jgi:RNA polymerase sigma-70 factor, ECF subfamily
MHILRIVADSAINRVFCRVLPLDDRGARKDSMDELDARLARGEPAAFAELYDRCATRLHRYLVVRLGSRADADDVLQETFVHLARTRKRLSRVNDLVAYVFAAARNEAARFAGWRARGNSASQRAIDWCSCSEARPGETSEWVAAALARLAPELREIVELKIFAGLTFQEVASVTGLPQGTAATRYRTALRKLRIDLARERS